MPIAQSQAFFRTSPFELVANAETATYWAGRPDVRKCLDKICRAYVRRSDSSIDVIWANFGAGKTHALLHLAYMLAQNYADQAKTAVAFIEMPQNLNSFLDLYRRIIAAVPTNLLEACLRGVDDRKSNHNLRRAATAFEQGGSVEKVMARDWLLAEKPYLRELKSVVGIDSRIETDVIACDILDNIVSLCGQQGIRFVILLDEFQRIAVLPKRKRDPILSNVRSVFSHNSSFLSMVVAVSSRAERTALGLIPPELRTLMGMRPIISLPEMSCEEAEDYIVERLHFFRPAEYTGSKEAPFTSEMLAALVNFIHSNDNAKLIPRTLHKALAFLFDEIMDSPDQTMSIEVMNQELGELNWENLDVQPESWAL